MAKQPRPLRGAPRAPAAPGLTRGTPTSAPGRFGPRADGADTGGPFDATPAVEQACTSLGG